MTAPSVTATSSTSTIGVIGAGWLGGTVGHALAQGGHHVLFSSRHPEDLESLRSGVEELIQTGTVDQAAACDIILLATP